MPVLRLIVGIYKHTIAGLKASRSNKLIYPLNVFLKMFDRDIVHSMSNVEVGIENWEFKF